MEQIKPFDAITPDNIQDWKAKYGDVLKEVTIGQSKFVIKQPTRRVMDLMAQHGTNKDIVAANNTLINNCVLGGDMNEMEQDGNIYTSLLEELSHLLEKKKVSVKKL